MRRLNGGKVDGLLEMDASSHGWLSEEFDLRWMMVI